MLLSPHFLFSPSPLTLRPVSLSCLLSVPQFSFCTALSDSRWWRFFYFPLTLEKDTHTYTYQKDKRWRWCVCDKLCWTWETEVRLCRFTERLMHSKPTTQREAEEKWYQKASMWKNSVTPVFSCTRIIHQLSRGVTFRNSLVIFVLQSDEVYYTQCELSSVALALLNSRQLSFSNIFGLIMPLLDRTGLTGKHAWREGNGIGLRLKSGPELSGTERPMVYGPQHTTYWITHWLILHRANTTF